MPFILLRHRGPVTRSWQDHGDPSRPDDLSGESPRSSLWAGLQTCERSSGWLVEEGTRSQ